MCEIAFTGRILSYWNVFLISETLFCLTHFKSAFRSFSLKLFSKKASNQTQEKYSKQIHLQQITMQMSRYCAVRAHGISRLVVVAVTDDATRLAPNRLFWVLTFCTAPSNVFKHIWIYRFRKVSELHYTCTLEKIWVNLANTDSQRLQQHYRKTQKRGWKFQEGRISETGRKKSADSGCWAKSSEEIWTLSNLLPPYFNNSCA